MYYFVTMIVQQPYSALPEISADNPNENQTEISEKSNAVWNIIILQTVICSIILVAVVCIKFLMPQLFKELSVKYRQTVGSEINIEQVLNEENEPSGSGGPLITADGANIKASKNFNLVVPVSGKVSSAFGYRIDPFTGVTAFHSGTDIAVNSGSPVRAAISGTVKKATKNGGDYGTYVVVENGAIKTLYGHLADFTVYEGQRVNAGQMIAYSGNTGRSTGPHLHFELSVQGQKIDPEPFLR